MRMADVPPSWEKRLRHAELFLGGHVMAKKKRAAKKAGKKAGKKKRGKK